MTRRVRGAVLALLVFAIPAAAAEPIALIVGESRTLQMMGASAAWSIDGAIAEASARDGHVTIFGRGAGTTKVIVVSITGENAVDVVVAPRHVAPRAAPTPHARTMAEVRYSSAARELQNSVTVRGANSETSVRLIHASAAEGDRASTSVATAYYRLFDRDREITILDRDVDHSALTLRNTPVRGLHYRDDRWHLHAGYTAFATYRSLFVPIERQFVAGGGYTIRTGRRSMVRPSVFTYFGEGTVLSLVHEYRDVDRLATRMELAYSRGIGAAAEVSWTSARDRVDADVRYRGDDFAVATPASPRGFFGDASWMRRYGRGSVASVILAATDVAASRVLSGSADVDHRLSDVLSLTGGASWSSFDGTTIVAVPAGVRLDWARGGMSALYRRTSGGDGFRLTARASLGRFYAAVFADRQEHAPTLDLIFAAHPGLVVALDDLGIAATSPADIARALREHAVLAELGFIEGVTIELAPVRTQLGLDVSLLGASASRQQFRARLLRNVVETVSSRTTTTMASLSYSRRVTASADVFAAYSWWRTERRGETALVQPVFEIGIRGQFDGAPAFGRRTISGIVYADEDLDGRSDGAGVAAVLELDGSRVVRTAPDGTFAFDGVGPGAHHVVARVPDRPNAYFTTPSRVEVNAGETVSFGVASSPARLGGRVVSDAGSPVGGVRMMLARGPRRIYETTGDDGRFSFAAPPGEWQLSVVGDSVPAGHATAEPRDVMLDLATPAHVEVALRAHRAIAGEGAPSGMEIEVRPSRRRVRADAAGRFVVRALPPGPVTLVAGTIERQVVMPAGPATVPVSLHDRPRGVPAAAARRTTAASEGTARHVVLIGAFRSVANAERTADRARRSGVAAALVESGSLTVVRSGPYATRADADEAAARLTSSGLEAVVRTSR